MSDDPRADAKWVYEDHKDSYYVMDVDWKAGMVELLIEDPQGRTYETRQGLGMFSRFIQRTDVASVR